MSVSRFLVSIVNLTFAFSHIHVACYKSLYIINLLLSFFNRGDSTQHEEPFRAWFSKIGELRSLCPKAQMIALTATSGPAQRRKIMKHLCFTGNNEVIVESPDRTNINLTSKCIPNNDILDNVFGWLIEDLTKKETINAPPCFIL